LTLRLITGKASTGKTGAVVRAVGAALDAGRTPVVIVPSAPDATRLLDELALSYPLGVRATTFERFLEDAWAQFGDGRAVVTPAQRRLLATSVARAQGARPALGRLAASCAISLASQVGETWRAHSAPDRGPGVALGRVLAGYGAALSRLGLVEADEAAHQLAGLRPVLGDPLVVHGFTDFTHAQEALITSARETAETLVTLTWAPEFGPTDALTALVARLRPDEMGDEGETAFHTATTLDIVANGLFGPPRPLDPGDAVAFRTAQGAEAEARGIADEILALRRLPEYANGVKSIAVVFRDPERHFPFVREAFESAGIQADYDVRLPFAGVPFGAAVTELFRFAAGGQRDRLTALLRSPFSGAEREAARTLETLWRGRGIEDTPALLGGLRGLGGLAEVVEVALACGARPSDARGAAALSRAVNRLFVLGYGRSGAPSGPELEADSWALASVERLLSDVAALDDRDLTVTDVLDALMQETIGPRDVDRPGYVQVTAVDRVRGRRFSTVIIGGLVASEFPAAPAETMIPGSAIDDVLRGFGGTGEERLGPDYERMLFYLALTRARDRLVLSACEADSDGEAMRISPLFEAVADFFRPAEEDAALPAHKLEPLTRVPDVARATTPRDLARAAAYAGDGAVPRARAARARAQSRSATLNRDESLAALAGRDTFSPSELESYLACPYKWFYEKQLRPGALERETTLADQGTFAHELLAATYRELRAAGVPRMSTGSLAAAGQALDRAYTAACIKHGQADVTGQLQRRTAKSWAVRVLEDDVDLFSGFEPTYLEWGFGVPDTPVVEMDGWSLQGRVDRIDVDESGYAVVMDYKRTKGATADHILSKRKVQVSLYIEAVSRGLGLQPVAGLYRALRSRDDRGLLLGGHDLGDGFSRTDIKSTEEFERIHTEALRLASDGVAGIRAGEIGCDPIDGACEFCSAKVVCGSAR